MECFYPREARQAAPGEKLNFRPDAEGFLVTIPCGKCIGCRVGKAREWAIRVMHEAQMHKENCFVTLTYKEEFVGNSLDYSDFQKFMKRLRKRMPSRNIRFFMSGEYGSDFGRPHFHACLFGVDFHGDRYAWRKTQRGDTLYRSPTLENLWDLGHVEFGEVTLESAQYVAQYVVKKVSGDKAEAHYEDFDRRTGEVIQKVPEFGNMSLRPGIGLDWLRKFYGDILNVDALMVDGHKVSLPRYYKDYLALYHAKDYSRIVDRAAAFVLKNEPEMTAKRADVREFCLKDKIKAKKRSL